MRWKLYNNPYYFACAASAEKHLTILPNYEGHMSSDSLSAADCLALDTFRAHCSPDITTEAQKIRNSDRPSLLTGSDSVKQQHLGIESAHYSAEKSTQGLCKDLGEENVLSVPSRSSKRLFKSSQKHRTNVEQMFVLSDSDRMAEAMQRELHKVWVQVQELEEACIWARMEINNLQLRVDHAGAKGKSWPSKVYAKLAAKMLSIKEDAAHELSHESQHQQQRLHIKNLENQLAESKAALLKAKTEMVKERKGREILELICSELARKVDQDQVNPDQLKKDPDDTKKNDYIQTQGECKILEAWREEKIQVKLSEAKFEVAHSTMSRDSSFEQKLKSFLAEATTPRRIRRV